MQYESEVEKMDKVQSEFWRSQFSKAQAENRELKDLVARMKFALSELKCVAEMLSYSGDNPLDYEEMDNV